MGVLDEAIRQHLELRRKHGATEDELERQEAEALGPARREPASPPLGDNQPVPPSGLTEGAGESGGDGVLGESVADADADEVPAEEALEGGTPSPTSSVAEDSGPGGVFDVEELGPPEDAPDGSAVARGAAPPPDAEQHFLDAEVVDEEVLDEEELAEEELAEELAGGDLSEEERSDALLGDRQTDAVREDERAADESPEGAAADDGPEEAIASPEEGTILSPPPPVDRGEADTSEFDAAVELLPEEEAEDDELLEGEAALTDDAPLEEDDELPDEDDPLEDELDEEEEVVEPAELHVAADEDLDAEDDAEQGFEDPGPRARTVSEPESDEADDPAVSGSPDASEDVLEETPEFLQETPEHERLWFEQQPPRDFDLDR